MAIVPVALTNKSAPSRFRQGGDAHLINCYVEQIGEEGKSPWAIYSSDGLQGYCTLPDADGGIRATLYMDDKLYVVAGTKFYSVNPTTQAVTYINSLGNISKTAPLYMERNRRSFDTVTQTNVAADIMIVCDGVSFYYRNGTTFGQITTVDGDIKSAKSLAYNNGYFVISTSEGNQYQAGSIDDVLNWNTLSYGVADADPDEIVRVAQYQGDIAIFGLYSIEFARDVGSQPFPYQTVQSVDIGIFGANSVATVEQSLAFVGQDRSVRILSGYEAKKISTHSVDRAIEAIEDPDELIATSWVNSGHTFYCLSSLSWTWVYDTVTGLWHERKTNGSDRWNISNVIRVDDKLIAGDRTSGVLYEMSSSYKDDNGEDLVSTIVLPPVHAFPHPLTFNSVYLDVQAGGGVGVGNPEDVSPSVMIEWSENGGDSYKGLRHLALGEQGHNLTRVRAWRLGQSKEDGYTFKLSWSAKVARAIYGMAADVEKDAA